MTGGHLGATAPVRNCTVCRATFVGDVAWRNGDRRGADTYHGGYGRCIACYSRIRREAARAAREPRPRAPMSPIIMASDLLEDYDVIRDSVTSIRGAAERMGVSFARLDMALYRARKRGDERGRAPVEQRARAIDSGTPFGRQHRRRAA